MRAHLYAARVNASFLGYLSQDNSLLARNQLISLYIIIYCHTGLSGGNPAVKADVPTLGAQHMARGAVAWLASGTTC